MMNDAIFMPISIMFFFLCVKWLICLHATNNFALHMDQDVNDYFEKQKKN